MKKINKSIIVCWILCVITFLTSCSGREHIKFHIKNLSESNVDSIKVVLEKAETTSFSTLEPEERIELEMPLNATSATAGGKIFEIYYSQNGILYMANFGYHTGNGDIRSIYSVFIFPNGVGENKNQAPPLNKNKIKVHNWPK